MKFRTAYSWREASMVLIDAMEDGSIDSLTTDVFDTLLLRNTDPEVVVEATVGFVAERTGFGRAAVRRARQDAWADETRKSVEAGFDPDCKIEAYFRGWMARLGAENVDSLAAAAVAFEVDSERACLRRNQTMMDVLTRAKAAGVRVTALSDMYLSAPQVTGLLNAHGYAGLIDEVVTSGDIGLQKRTGRMFDWFKARHPKSSILHVGDDRVADGAMASERGVPAVFVFDRGLMKARAIAKANGNDRGVAARGGAIMASGCANAGGAEGVGARKLGPIYAGFVGAVVEKAATEAVDSVWFMAREGWMLREIYEEFRNTGIEAPPSGYLYVSRVAAMRAQLEGFGTEEARSVLADNWKPTYRAVLSPLRLPECDLAEACRAAGLSPDQAALPEGIERLAASPPLDRMAKAIGEAERSGLAAYLEKTGFPSSGRVALVDVGWGGQIQENFERALRKIGFETEVLGYYLGTDERAADRRRRGYQMEALLVDKTDNDGRGLGAFAFVQGLELSTRSAHGSVRGYSEDGIPVLAEGTEGRMREEADDPMIAAVQRGVLSYAAPYAAHAKALGLVAEEGLAIARDSIDLLAFAPSRDEAAVFASMSNVANLGMDEEVGVAADVSWRRPGALRRALAAALWKEGTSAMAAPLIGPIAMVAYKRFRGLMPLPTTSDRIASSTAPRRNVGSATVVTADVMGLELGCCRGGAESVGTAFDARGFTAELRDGVALCVVRMIVGARRQEAGRLARLASAMCAYAKENPANRAAFSPARKAKAMLRSLKHRIPKRLLGRSVSI